MSAGFNFNNIQLSDAADITDVMENFTKIETYGITDEKATRLASSEQNGWMSMADKDKLDGIATGATANIGTITSVVAGTGLTGGASSGAATLNVSYGSTSGTACEGNDSRLSNNRTPTAHASSATTYGVGSTTNYGHCKTINALTSSSFTDGEALSAYQGYILNAAIQGLTPVVGTYTGNGSTTNSNLANLGFLPKILICVGPGESSNNRQYSYVGIFVYDGTTYQFSISGKDLHYISSAAVTDPSISISVTGNGFTITTGNGYTPTWLNNNNQKYTYFAIK